MVVNMKWWLYFLCGLLLPFGLVTLTHEIGILIPGLLKRSHWGFFSSAIFVLGAISLLILLSRSSLRWWLRAMLAILALPVLIFAAGAMQTHSTCGPYATYLGETVKNWNDSECGD